MSLRLILFQVISKKLTYNTTRIQAQRTKNVMQRGTQVDLLLASISTRSWIKTLHSLLSPGWQCHRGFTVLSLYTVWFLGKYRVGFAATTSLRTWCVFVMEGVNGCRMWMSRWTHVLRTLPRSAVFMWVRERDTRLLESNEFIHPWGAVTNIRWLACTNILNPIHLHGFVFAHYRQKGSYSWEKVRRLLRYAAGWFHDFIIIFFSFDCMGLLLLFVNEITFTSVANTTARTRFLSCADFMHPRKTTSLRGWYVRR